jgi:amino acid transporter
MEAHARDTREESAQLDRRSASGRLAANVLGLGDGVVLGFASAAPGASIAGVLGALVVASGHGAILALIVGAIPLLCIAAAFFHLNREDVNVGISYAWIARFLNPLAGAFVGFVIVLAFVLSNSFGVIPASANFLSLISHQAANSKGWTSVAGLVILALITLLVIWGIRIAARFQWVMTGIEMLIFLAFGALALSKGHYAPSLSWLSLHAAGGFKGLSDGLLITVFWYSGWETAVVVNEETRRAHRTPGLAGIGGIIGVVIISAVLAMMFLSAVSPKTMGSNAAWLTSSGFALAGHPWGYLLVAAIVISYWSSLATTVITFGNVGFSMGRDRVLWRRFGHTGRRTRTPIVAIVVLAALSMIIFLLQVWAGGSIVSIIGDLSSALGFLFVIYYALTGITAAWALRRAALRRAVVLFTGVLLPLVGTGSLIWIGWRTWGQSNNATRITFGVVIVGSIVAAVLSKGLGHSEFFRRGSIATPSTEPGVDTMAVPSVR